LAVGVLNRLRSLGPQVVGGARNGKLGHAYFKTTTADMRVRLHYIEAAQNQ
jgi:hypothetical protein